MLDGGPASSEQPPAPGSGNPADGSDIAEFVDRLAAAGTDPATEAAHRQVRQALAAGHTPPGLRMLAEALAESVAERPPSPRTAPEDGGAVAAAMRSTALVVLAEADGPDVAGAVAALLADGRRTVVTGGAGELAAVRAALPVEVGDRVVDRLPALAPAELRELRRLLATSTPARRARAGQRLPQQHELPPADEVGALCATAAGAGPQLAGPPGEPVRLVTTLLGELDADRRAAVTAVAAAVVRSLAALPARERRPWAWTLLAELIYTRHRPTLDRMLEDTAQAVAVLERTRDAPPVRFAGAPPAGAVDLLLRYHEFLGAGGRSRSYFRGSLQRQAEPVLAQIRVGERVPETEEDLRHVLAQLELGERLARIGAGCVELGAPAPHDGGELAELARVLVAVGAAARSVGALRHDVLFIAPGSPLSVPDLDTAERVAAAILDYAESGSALQAGERLDRLAEELAARMPIVAAAPEHAVAVVALRAHDADGYRRALRALAAAGREAHDEQRRAELLQRLTAGSPRLADALAAAAEGDPAVLGFAYLVPAEQLLAAIPPPDSVDVLVLLGAGRLGVERLLLAAVAPRMVAAAGPGEQPPQAPGLLGVLRQAGALVIRTRPAGGGQVVALTSGATRAVGAAVGQAGA